MNKQKNVENSIEHDPTGALVKLFEEISKTTGIKFEDISDQLPEYISKPVRERLASKKNK